MFGAGSGDVAAEDGAEHYICGTFILQTKRENIHYATSHGKLGGDEAVAGESTGGYGSRSTALAHLHMAEFVAPKLRAILPSAFL